MLVNMKLCGYLKTLFYFFTILVQIARFAMENIEQFNNKACFIIYLYVHMRTDHRVPHCIAKARRVQCFHESGHKRCVLIDRVA